MEIFNYGCLVTTAFGQTRHIAPSSKLFVPNGLTEYNNLSFLTCLWCSPRGGWSAAAHQWSNPGGGRSPALPAAPALRPVVSSGSLMGCNPFPCTNPFLFVLVFLILEWPAFQCSGPYAVLSSFLRFGGGRTFQNVQPFTPCTTTKFTISSRVDFLEFPSDFLRIRRHTCCLEPRFLFLMPALHSWLLCRIFSNLLPLGALFAVRSLPGLLHICPLRTAGTARRMTRLRAADDFCRDPNTVLGPLFTPVGLRS
jgi:hypothetical protein